MKNSFSTIKKEWVTPQINTIEIKRTLGSKASGLESNTSSNNGKT